MRYVCTQTGRQTECQICLPTRRCGLCMRTDNPHSGQCSEMSWCLKVHCSTCSGARTQNISCLQGPQGRARTTEKEGLIKVMKGVRQSVWALTRKETMIGSRSCNLKSVVQDQLGMMQPRLMMSTSALKQAQHFLWTAVQRRVHACACASTLGWRHIERLYCLTHVAS